MPDTYDSVPYTSFAYPYTHPDMLCTLGRLFGLSPAPPRRCRVLELGCASGGNLLPMAELLPEAQFVGVDRSRVQIDRGRALVGELGLTNVRLEQGDILRLDPQTLGTFDYVIAHGVFSWVPHAVQDRLLALAGAVLRPKGLAFISYNVYPGWHMREHVRRMMLFHLRRFEGPTKQIEQARALLEFIAGAVEQRGPADDPYAVALARELETLRKMSDAYLFHEHLERDNSPLYFHEFIDRLGGYPLRYLCDTDLNLMVARDMPEAVRETLGRVATDQLRMEQYLDFVRNRQFRTSVLCRIEAAPQRRIEPDRMTRLRFTMAGKPKLEAPESSPDLTPGVELGFECVSGAQISSPAPLTKAALLELCERWPATVPFDELVEAARARLLAAGLELEAKPEPLAADLIECLLRKAVIARVAEPPLAPSQDPDHNPRLSNFNRISAEREGWIASLHHHRIELAPPQRQLAALLDGTRDRAQLIAELTILAGEGELHIRDAEGQRLGPGPALDAAIGVFVDEQLELMRRWPALLA